MTYPLVILKPKREVSVQRRHPWVFSGAIAKIVLSEDKDSLKHGELVYVCDSRENIIATGHFSEGSIAVRVLSFKERLVNDSFWKERFKQAFELREKLSLSKNVSTSCYRLVHAEGDGLPGLIVDVYNETAILQAHSKGMESALLQIAKSLKEASDQSIQAVYSKSPTVKGKQLDETLDDSYLIGKSNCPQTVFENDLKFEIDWIRGQKTGFFIDQRENRKLLQRYSEGKKVLNTFCYSGGFSVYALAAKARLVHSVDSSAKAIELTENNVQLNFGSSAPHESFTNDTFSFLTETEEIYDLIVLDPPAYAKSKSSSHKAVQGYKRLNARALELISKGGILFTFSCSQVIHRKLFEDTIRAAAIEAKRTVKILHHLSQPADHPVSIFHPEGEYLKGLVLFIEE